MRGTRTRPANSGTSYSVHPRACGELEDEQSPVEPGKRFIPAHAGNSAGPVFALTPLPVHPRACGELARCPGFHNLNTTVHPRACGELKETWHAENAVAGSSPRMRGTLHRSHAVTRFVAVHPRACGELTNWISPAIPVSGSSPRMRGTLHRIACGAHRQPFVTFGSSPRMRGTLRTGSVRRFYGQRFIPAHAGNSGRSLLLRCKQRRRCQHGSSPRMRGTHCGHRRNRFHCRPSVHPRACGELALRLKVVPTDTGSSPRMRGTPPAHASDPVP